MSVFNLAAIPAWVFLLTALLLNAGANILLKIGSKHVATESSLVSAALTSPYLITGVLLFALNVMFYILALSRLPLSIAYPIMTSGGFLIITIVAFFFLKESISLAQILGLVFLVLGITLIASKLS